MKLMREEWLRFSFLVGRNAKRAVHGTVTRRIGSCMLALALAVFAGAQGVSTTTVQGTVYLANGQPGAGTLVLSWPAFTTATGQAIAADSTTTTIAPDGFVSVNLAPNVGATPAGEYYTAVFYMSDGSTSTQYWVVPAAAQATLAQVQAQVMPAAQATQAVSKAYVDQSIAELSQSLLTASGGNLSGPLYLDGDPTQALQAADKHYVDMQVGTAVPLAGGNMAGALTTPAVNGVQAPAAGSAQTNLQAAMNAAGTSGALEIPPAYAGTDTFTNPNGVRVMDMRTTGAQPSERSVKEFGAVCDGVTDDTNALQTALNYANAHGVALTIPQGTCKTRALNWRGESIGGLGKQVSALMGFPGQDVLEGAPDAANMLSNTRLHDLTIYVDQSADVSCAPAEGRAAAGSCQVSRPMEANSIFSAGGNGLANIAGTGAAWWVGNCAVALQAATGAGGNGLRVAEIENLEIEATGTDPMATQYSGAHSTHTCGMYLAQWPQWSEFRNIDVRGVNTGIAIPALPVTVPAGLNADSNRWQNVTIQATHAFTAAAGSNNVLDNVVAMAGNSAAMGEPPTGLVLDLGGNAQGWTVRNAVVMPTWNAIQPQLIVTTAGGAVTSVTPGSEHGLGWDPYGTTVPVAFSGGCTAQATAAVNSNGAIGSVTVTQGGVGCSATTTASIYAIGTWDTAAPVNLIGGQDMTFFAGNLLKGTGGYTVWNATSSASYGTQLDGGGGTLPGGGQYAALVAHNKIGNAYQVDQFPGADLGAKLQACVNAIDPAYGGTCDARNFTGNQTLGSNLTISTANTAILLPCATITTASQIIVTAGTRNVALRGCALRGGTATSGSQGGTVFAYSGAGTMVQVGDPAYALDTPGFHLDNSVINTTAAQSGAQGLVAYRTQEIDLASLYLLGNSNQVGITLDGTGNYTGGTFLDDQLGGYGTAVKAIGHEVANPATTDWMNASTFIRLHIDCPTLNGAPISGTYGIDLQQADGNSFTGGDIEGCATALHLGPNAQNNTIVGLRNENSTNQVVADAGSAYNNWITGGTMFTGKLADSGTRNSFLDTFHRSFNGLNGDWYGSQQDATVTNHFRLGTGAGNERGLLNRYQTDYGYRWTTGFSDATAGEQFYQVLDELNNVYRLSIGQYNNGQPSTNNQTVLNSAGTGAVVLNGANNAGTGGVIFGSGGPSETTVATISSAGNAQFNGALQVGGTSQSTGTITVRNSADAEVDYYLWPGLTTSQKGSFTYKDWNGNSQWYMLKDASNNWALNSATGGLDSFKAYQSGNSGDTYLDTSNSSGHIRLNYETGSGTETDIYSGPSANLDAAFQGPTSIKFPGLAASSGHSCLQVDTSGYLTNTGSACGTGSGGSNGTINSANSGQIAYYTGSGTTIGGMNAVPVASGGTGATSTAGAMSNLLPGIASDGSGGITVLGSVAAGSTISGSSPYADIRAYGGISDGTTDIGTALNSTIAAQCTSKGGVSCTVLLPCGGSGCYLANGSSINSDAFNGTLQIKLQGNLKLGSTLVLPGGISLLGDGGGGDIQYQGSGPTATITPPNVSGTMGTAITATNTPTTFNPTFTTGTSANMPVNSAITIAGTMSCTMSATRTSASNENVTLSVSGSCLNSSGATVSLRIPPAALINISNCSDSSFNRTGLLVQESDYPAKTLTTTETGAVGSATGCTVTGFNDDDFETVRIIAMSGSTATAVFNETHAASDLWGMVAIAPPYESFAHNDLENISVAFCSGACYWLENSAFFNLVGDGFQAGGVMTSEPVEIDSTWWGTIKKSALNTLSSNINTCYNGNCQQPSYPYGLHCTMENTYRNPSHNSPCSFSSVVDSTVVGGIKVDQDNLNLYSIDPPAVRDSILEHPTGNGITVDNRYQGSQHIILDNTQLQDAYFLNDTTCLIGYTDASGGGGSATIRGNSSQITQCLANKYYGGNIAADDAVGINLAIGRGATVGTYDGNGEVETELRGEGASMGPSVVPYSTLPVSTSPSSWACSGCTIANVLAPDGTTNAGEITAGSGGGNTSVVVGGYYGSTYAGDHFIYGVWARPGANETQLNGCSGSVADLQDYGTDSFGQSGTNAFSSGYDMSLFGDWWHPIVALATIVTGESAGHSINFNLHPGCSAGQGNQFFQPFLMYIPASAGIPLDEIERWRQQLMHGMVPQNFSANGDAVSAAPVAVPRYDILNSATGAITPLGTAALADWSNSGVANGSYPSWNSGTGKWTPAILPSFGPLAIAAPNGLIFGNGTGAPSVATGAQMAAAIGSTAVANASSATNFTGSLSGDVSGSQGATTVSKLNGGSIPANAKVLGTNSSGQPISTTVAGSGAGLITGPTTVGASGNVTEFTGTGGQIADSGTAFSQVTLLGTAQTMNAAHLHTGNAAELTNASSTTSTTLTTSGIVLPSIPANTTVHGSCAIIWEGSSTSYSTTIGMGANNAPTDLWVIGTMHAGANGGTLADKYTTITSTTATAVTTAGTPGAASTGYRADIDFTLATGSNPVTLTLYYASSSGSGTSYIEPGSACWLM